MARPQLSDRQVGVLRFVREYSALASVSPTIREVASHLGASPRGAELHLRALARMGYLDHIPRLSRGYRVVRDPPAAEAPAAPDEKAAVSRSRGEASDVSANEEVTAPQWRVPIVGRVPGGRPSHQEPEDLGELFVPFRVSEGVFAVRVAGHSMRDAHILDGDLAVADPAVQATDRSVVIALLHGEYTVKTLRMNAHGEWWLEAANEEYPPMRPSVDGDKVSATVVALVRTRVGKQPRATIW